MDKYQDFSLPEILYIAFGFSGAESVLRTESDLYQTWFAYQYHDDYDTIGPDVNWQYAEFRNGSDAYRT